MKNFSILVCLGSLLFAISCKKDKAASLPSLEGTWELRRVSGMFTTTYVPGNGNTIIFHGSNYEMYSNGQLTQSGHYKIVNDSGVESATCLVIPAGQYTQRIIYDNNNNDRKIFIEISNNKLTFLSGCFAYDAGSSQEYAKQ